MKIDFGETEEENIERLEKWHTIFAWLPHRVDSHDYRWLEYIERRGIIYQYWSGPSVEWEYRLIGESNG